MLGSSVRTADTAIVVPLSMSSKDRLPWLSEPDATTGGVDAPGCLPGVASLERELWFVALAAMLIDVTLTVHGLQLGLRELNPVARAFLDAAGALGLYFLKLIAVLVAVCGRKLIPTRYGWLVPLALALPSTIAVVVNASLIAYVVL